LRPWNPFRHRCSAAQQRAFSTQQKRAAPTKRIGHRIELAERHESERLEIIVDMNSARRKPFRDVLRVRESISRSKRFDQAFLDPAVNMIRKAPQRAVLRIATEVHELCNRFAGAIQQPMDGIGLHSMHRKFTNDVLFIFSKDRGSMTHIGSINRGRLCRVRVKAGACDPESEN
jgi:hypothetical protein